MRLNSKDVILADTVSFYQQNIPNEIKAYLVEERKFSEGTIEQFKLGYAKGGLREHLIRELSHSEEMCLEAGVLKKTTNGEIRDFFFNRIIFPNIKRERVVHLSGRSMSDIEPKYLHLPGEINSLFNEDALNQKEVLITEGAPDCITAVQAGYSAVAVLGAGTIKRNFISKFSRCEKVYVCMDGDEAGERGGLKFGQLLPKKSYVVRLPEGTDLNEYMKTHSREDLDRLVRSSKKFPSYLLEKIPIEIDKTELPTRLEGLINVLSKMNPADQEHFLEHKIKTRFSFTTHETNAYRKTLQERRKENASKKEECVTQDKQRTHYIAKFDGLVDLVLDDGTVVFLIKTGNVLSTSPNTVLSGDCFYPPNETMIPWLLVRKDRVVAAYEECLRNPSEYCKKLYNDVVNRLKEISDLPDDSFYDLCAGWVFHTYVSEGIQYTPILCLHALPERGKSRTGKGVTHISYRGIHVESLREAYIFRVAENFESSIFFDVKDIRAKAEKAGSDDILLQRFERGVKVPRVLFPDKGAFEDTVFYNIFGPTIIATNEGIDPILETRSVCINMPEAQRRFENDVIPEDALALKERLTAFRAFYLGQALPETTKPAPGRLGDILKPLRQIFSLVNPEKEAVFLGLVERIQRQRLLDKSESLDAEVLVAIAVLSNQAAHGILSVKEITKQVNLKRSENMKLSPHRIGRRIKAMGITRARTATGSAAIQFDRRQIDRLLASFGLESVAEIMKV